MTVPDRHNPKSQTAATPDFRRRFDELERRHLLLIAKHRSLDGIRASHPGYRSAQLLLNKTFRKAFAGAMGRGAAIGCLAA